MSVVPMLRAALSGLIGRPLQAFIIGLVSLTSTAAAALALGLIVQTNTPFDHAFGRDRGAQVMVTADTSRASAATLATTTRLPQVTAAVGPLPETVVTAHIALPGASGSLEQQLLLVGRASPGGPVDDLSIDAGRWARTTGEVVWAQSRNSLPVALGQVITVVDATGLAHLTVVGVATSVTGSAQAWVTPAEIARLHPAGSGRGPGIAQMLYRFAGADSAAAVTADITAIRNALPPGSLLGPPLSYLTIRKLAGDQTAPWVPFIVAFGIMALAMSVLITVNIVSGAVVVGTRRIGVLKSIGFTPLQVTAAYVLQVVIPAVAGCAAGAACADLLSAPLLSISAAVYGVGVLFMPLWVVVIVPLTMLAVSVAAATGPALRAGRMPTVRAITTGRAPRAAHGYAAYRLLARLYRVPRVVSLGLAEPFARPARTLVTLVAIGFGVIAVTFGTGLDTSLHGAANDLSLAQSAPVQVSPNVGLLTPAQDATVTAALNRQPGTRYATPETQDQLSIEGQAGSLSITAYAGSAQWTGWSVITGRWYFGAGQVDVNTYFLTATGTKVGDSYTLTSGGRQTTVRIVGEIFDSGSVATMFMSSSTLNAVAPGLRPAQYDVSVSRGVNVQSYANELSARLGPSFDVTTSTDSPVFRSVLVLVLVLTVLLMVVAGLGVLNTITLQIRERAHGLGIFKAIGMTPLQTLAMVVCSVIGTGIVAGVIALPGGVALHRYVVPIMGHAAQSSVPAALLSVYHPAELALLALSGLLIAVAGAIGPASRVARTRTATALRAE